jgi:hypothetical protein
MNDQITALLSQALADALKQALVPIVRDAVNEALASQPKEEKPLCHSDEVVARFTAIEERLDSLESDMTDKVDQSDINDHVQDCIDSGSFSIEFRG